MSLLDNLAVLLPKGKQKAGGTGYTPTYRGGSQPRLATPTYRDHTNDLYDTRYSADSRTLLNDLVRHDPDASSAIHSYLTVCGSAPLLIQAYDDQGQLSADGIALGKSIFAAITETSDYTIGTTTKPGATELSDQMRYLTLLRGGPAAELIFDKRYVPTELRLIDPASVVWDELAPGRLKPTQKPAGSNVEINLDLPTFFTSRFHQNPTDQFNYSTFVSSINTIAARQQVVNELYRLMRLTGFPRLDVKVLEEVLTRSAPAALRNDPDGLRAFVGDRMQELQGYFDGVKSDQAIIHTDAVETSIINDKNPSVGINMEGVISTLDSQNQAALKVMPAVVGKGLNAQTASVEARLFALSCDALNRTVANIYTPALTLAARLAGFQGKIVATFAPVEMRPQLELEPMKVIQASRLLKDLSLGIISDEEYSFQMYHRPPLPGAPVLSGTGFMEATAGAQVDVGSISPNDDPLGRSLAPAGSEASRSNANPSGGGNRAKGS